MVTIINEFDIQKGKVDCKLMKGDVIIEHEKNLTTDRALEINDLWRIDYNVNEKFSKTYAVNMSHSSGG